MVLKLIFVGLLGLFTLLVIRKTLGFVSGVRDNLLSNADIRDSAEAVSREAALSEWVSAYFESSKLIDKLKVESEKWHEKFLASQHELELLKTANVNLRKRVQGSNDSKLVETLTREADSLRKELLGKQKLIDELRDTNKTLHQTALDLGGAHGQKDSQVSVLTKTRENLLEEIKRLNIELADAQGGIENLAIERNDLYADCRSLEEENEKLRKGLKSFETESAGLRGKIAEYERQIAAKAETFEHKHISAVLSYFCENYIPEISEKAELYRNNGGSEHPQARAFVESLKTDATKRLHGINGWENDFATFRA